MPDFCKIDVEGYEIEVLRGLSRPLPLLQFEYQPWSTTKAIECVDYLAALAPCRFNITMSPRRDDNVALRDAWIGAPEISDLLRTTVADKHLVGDVFVRRG